MNYSKNLMQGILLCTLVLSACTSQPDQTQKMDFIKTAYFDSSVSPADNFFMYVNGGWLKTAVIPGTESRIGAFMDLRNNNRKNLKSILEEAAASKAAAGSIEQKVGDFYASGMDSTAIDALGYNPIKPILQKVDALLNPEQIASFVTGESENLDILLFMRGVRPDLKNSSVNILNYFQGGLGLPDRDYYFKTDEATQKIVTAYKVYITKLFTLTGVDSVSAVQKAEEIFNLEKQLAASHKTRVELRDPNANYHKMSLAAFDKQVPNLFVAASLKQLGVQVDSINVGQPEYFTRINALIASVPVEKWKDYLKFHIINNYATLLSGDFEKANFAFHNTALSGQKEMKPRWERITNITDRLLGQALGQLYVKKYFDADSKKRMMELVDNLQKAFSKHIDALDWMSDSTKKEAHAKLESFIKKIGYPDKWKDYSKVTITRNEFFDNYLSAAKNEYEYQKNKIGKPVDKTEWFMTPPTVNAYYNPTVNEIVFPAGILQYPFFDPKADDALNYGGIGMVIGHEMTHGFDDQGAQFDKEGNLKMWWTPADYANFKVKANKVIEQYNSFTVLDSIHVNGALTNGENIADLGGISIAYDAFKMTKEGQDTTRIDGFTPDQRFFISLAQVWRSRVKDEALRQQINTDPHSPAIWRVNGPLMNFTPFYKAFNIQPGDGMYKADSLRIKIW